MSSINKYDVVVYEQSFLPYILRASLVNSNGELSIMLSPQLLALAFAMTPSLVSAALFPPDSLVKMIDAQGFKKVMKANVGLIKSFLDSTSDA